MADAPIASPTEPPSVTLTDAPVGPTRESERLPALDVLRGFALLGIFCVNIHLFAGPMAWSYSGADIGADDQWSRASAFFVKTLCEFKFVSLFSLLFGAGFAILLERLAAKNLPISVFYRRIAVLAGFGLLHGYGFWWGDILLLYAAVGCLLPLFRKTPPRRLTRFAVLFLALSVLVFAGALSLQVVGSDEAAVDAVMSENDGADASADDAKPEWVRLLGQADEDFTNDTWMRLELIAYGEGPLAATFIVRAIEYTAVFISCITANGFGLRILGMFLVGMALYRSGFFRRTGGPSPILLTIVGLFIGTLGEGLVGAHALTSNAAFGFEWIAVESGHHVASMFLCLGYVGLIMLASDVRFFRPIMIGLAAVGRLALTNYLTQTLICTTVMYWYGLGLYGKTERWEQLLFVALIYGMQVCFSLIWLRWFVLGPLEWVWRWLTYGRKPQFRRTAETVQV